MTPSEILSLALGVLAVVLIPGNIALIRGLTRFARVELQLNNLVQQVEALVINKDKTHSEIVAQMTQDRKATNDRLTWLERYVWRQIGPEKRGDNAIRDQKER